MPSRRSKRHFGRWADTGEAQGLLAALAARDGYTAEHSRDTVDLACEVGVELGLADLELQDLGATASLHDVGKIGISDAVLKKPGSLDEREWDEMRTHSEIGERIVAALPAVAHVAPFIRASHERWDGAGYPDGLKQNEIPLVSRIVFVADAYGAMTTDRPYRRALGTTAAVEDLLRNSGTQFWPQAADAAFAVISRRSRSGN